MIDFSKFSIKNDTNGTELYFANLDKNVVEKYAVEEYANDIILTNESNDKFVIKRHDINNSDFLKTHPEEHWVNRYTFAVDYLSRNYYNSLFFDAAYHVYAKEHCHEVFNVDDVVELSNTKCVRILSIVKCINGNIKYFIKEQHSNTLLEKMPIEEVK